MVQVVVGRKKVDVEWTMLDRAIATFSPKAGSERFKHRTMLALSGANAGGYDGGRRDRRATKRWRPPEASADADTLGDLPDLRPRSRDLIRNVPVATGALATRVTNVIGSGLRLIANVDHETLGISEEQADAMEREQEKEWEHFWATVDITRVQHGDELAALAYRSEHESGDSFLVRRYKERPGEVYGTKLQLLEADRVSNPNRGSDTDSLVGGIEFDEYGAPIAAHVSNKHPGDLRTAALKWERLPYFDADGRRLVIHLYDRSRPELSRGVPWIAPVVELLKQLGTYTDAEVTNAVVQSMYTVFIETQLDTSENPIAGEKDPSLAENELKLGAGAVLGLNPGETAKFPEVSRPNPQFDPFVMSLLRQIGVALGLPYELLIKHFTASYSASRAALEIAWQEFLKERKAFARRVYQTAYEWMMEEGVATGRLSRPGFFGDPRIRMAYCGAEWRGSARLSLNPYQEAQADALDMQNNVKTAEQVCAERTGGEIEKKIIQRGKEKALMAAAGTAPASPTDGKASPPANSADNPDDADAEDDDTETPARGRA